MAYELKRLGRQKIRYNSDNDDNLLIYQLVIDGVKVTPTSATVAIYAQGNSTAILAATAMTVSNSLMTYALDTTTVATWPVATGYRAVVVVTYDSKTYDRHFLIDVVGFILDISVGVDQLLDVDDSILGMRWAEDPNFAGVINSVRDKLQLKLEAKSIDDGQLIENMIIDSSKVAIPATYAILSAIYRAKKDHEAANEYKEEFGELWASVLSTMKYDAGQTGDEGSEQGGLIEVRLVT